MAEQPSTSAPYVFLSYTSRDRDQALAIADALEHAGVSVWLDRQSIHSGTSWGREIVEGIRQCTVLLIVCSHRALGSRNVRQEIQLGWRFEKPYLPILLEPVEFPPDVLYFLEGYQWLDLLDHPQAVWLPRLLTALAAFGVAADGRERARGDPDQPMGTLEPGRRAATPTHAPPGVDTTVGATAERRQVTAVACELADAATLAERLDPEDYHQLVHAFQARCLPVFEQAGGYVAHNRGDGLLVYFGYPTANEDDARRAVRSALGVAQRLPAPMSSAGSERGGVPTVRIGVHSGLVVIDRDLRGNLSILGETPTVASTLQLHAPTGGVVVSAATERLVRGHFDLERLMPSAAPGAGVVQWRVLAGHADQDRLDAAERLTPLVGRELELALLDDRWQRASEGAGQAVLVSGEPGIGKSRLVRTVRDRVEDGPHYRWEGRCASTYQNTALYPLVDLIQHQLAFGAELSPEARFAVLEEALLGFGLLLPEVAPLFATLLGLPVPDRYPPLNLSPERQRQQTLEALLNLLLAASEQRPLLFIIEDLHWADPTTLELLGMLVEQAAAGRMVVLLTARPEFVLPWPAHVTQLRLERLAARQVEQMAQRVAGGKALPEEVLHQVAVRTDGVPLFVEELTRMLVESGLLREVADRYELTGPLPAGAVPATLTDSLMARLDRLGEAKSVAQLGAVLGRTFSVELLEAVSPLREAGPRAALRQLLEAGLLLRRGVGSQTLYTFKHALIQDTAYQSLLRSTRQEYHRHVAQTLEARFPESVLHEPELLAHHCTEAGLTKEAIAYWQRAGEQAFARSAHAEALAHLQRGLELVATLPETPGRDRLELQLRLAIGPVYMNIAGYGAVEVARTFARARELSEALGDATALLNLLYGLTVNELVRAHHNSVRELAAEYYRLAEAHGDPSMLIPALRMVHWAHAVRGELEAAHAAGQQLLAVHDPVRDAGHIAIYGQDLRIGSLVISAMFDWLRGYPDRAAEDARLAIVEGRKLSHPYTMALVTFYSTILWTFRGDQQTASELVGEFAKISSEHGFGFWGTWAMMMSGNCTAEQGAVDSGVADMRKGLSILASTGALLFNPMLATLLASVLLKAGRLSEAESVLDEAGAMIASTGEVFYEAEVHRLRGVLVQASDEAAAERDFLRALEIARGQQAKSLELRAATSLARLWQTQGRRGAARNLLAEVYGWFSEGFTTRDLMEAQALLAALGS